ncbi:MAG: DAK2 domain-containing protein [Anaerolineae bacterium]|nr:DAK2 domain-containing protein [Anaerolineae bacterium]
MGEYQTKTGVKIAPISNRLEFNGEDLQKAFFAALAWLKTNQQTVNALNVFPVPDGDTGTNMVLTMQAAQNEISHLEEKNIGKMAHMIAQGALMGARGNSGVILSQIWRGFARGLDNYDTMDTRKLALALVEAKNTAYKGVVRPVEGTILTVIKDVATEAEAIYPNCTDLFEFFEKIVKAADESVKRTPELLPILKQAKVVDSGGKGLFYIFEGIYRFLSGESLESAIEIQPLSEVQKGEMMEAVEPGQDFEVVIDFIPNPSFDLQSFYNELEKIGTSIQVGEGDGMYRMHIHVPTDNRYTPIDYTMTLGTVTKVAIENLLAQMEGQNNAEAPVEIPAIQPGQIAAVTVSPGRGISRIFASLGIAAIVEGGQTMNPSTEEIISAFAELPTDKIIILPNNKNIVMAAQTAASATTDKKVIVVPSRSIPQGLSAMLQLLPEGDLEKVAASMKSALDDVITGEITVATRTVNLNGVDVQEGSAIALIDGKLVQSADTVEEACMGLLEKAEAVNYERLTFFSGNNITPDEITRIINQVKKAYPDHEIEVHEGGQPHYQFIIAIE